MKISETRTFPSIWNLINSFFDTVDIMACWEFECKKKIAKSECIDTLKNFRNRFFSLISYFKISQLVLAGSGMGLHVCQPIYRTLLDCSLVPAVLGTFSIVSAVLLFGHLFNFTIDSRLIVTFSIVASLSYGWCMSSIMDSVRVEEDTTCWTYLLAKGIVCFAALTIHLLELLHAFVTRDTRPLSLRFAASTHSISTTPSLHPMQMAI